jgi:hypothetical protein
MAEKATLFGLELVQPAQFPERYYTVRGREFHQVRQAERTKRMHADRHTIDPLIDGLSETIRAALLCDPGSFLCR